MNAISAQAANLLISAGYDVAWLRPVQVDRDCFECTQDELVDIVEHRAGDVVVVAGRYEDHGATGLVREEGRFMVLAKEPTFIRPRGAPLDAS